MQRLPTSAQRRAAGAGALAAIGSIAAAFAVAKRRRAARSPAGLLGAGAEPRPTLKCECGFEVRVSGRDRHHVYWPVDAPEGAPLLTDECPECGRALPARPVAATT